MSTSTTLNDTSKEEQAQFCQVHKVCPRAAERNDAGGTRQIPDVLRAGLRALFRAVHLFGRKAGKRSRALPGECRENPSGSEGEIRRQAVQGSGEIADSLQKSRQRAKSGSRIGQERPRPLLPPVFLRVGEETLRHCQHVRGRAESALYLSSEPSPSAGSSSRHSTYCGCVRLGLVIWRSSFLIL